MSSAPESYLSYFTPGQMSHETLEYIFVKRERLVDRLVERTRHSVLTAAKHQNILLGPRGMGKTHVVALVYHRVKALPELEGKVAIAWLAEEEWGIASLTDLFLVILKALAREYPDSSLQARVDALYRLPVNDVGGAAEAAIREFVGDRTLFLLMENLEEIFRGLDEQGQWAFRSFLNTRPFVTILATTPSLFAVIHRQDRAFYGFFQPAYLDELTAAEATDLLSKVAARRGDAHLADFLQTPLAFDRVQAIHDLAGGHPRIYLLFAHLITETSLDELVGPFLQLLDELTPYYQSRMQLLSPQQRKLIEHLCDRRGAAPVKDIAAATLLNQRIAAAQLGQLEEMRYVRKTVVGRESHYELFEPLLRMVIEIKRGRGEPIRLVVDFLRRWYSRAERHDVGEYGRLLIAPNDPDEIVKIAEPASVHATNATVADLGQWLTKSIPELLAPDVTQSRAEAWLAAWNAAGEGQPDLVVPLRLLAAAVAWKPKHDRRALLALAVEERRILEQLLPPTES